MDVNTRAAEERADRDVVSKHSIAKAHATVAVIQESDSTHIVGKPPIKVLQSLSLSVQVLQSPSGNQLLTILSPRDVQNCSQKRMFSKLKTFPEKRACYYIMNGCVKVFQGFGVCVLAVCLECLCVNPCTKLILIISQLICTNKLNIAA